MNAPSHCTPASWVKDCRGCAYEQRCEPLPVDGSVPESRAERRLQGPGLAVISLLTFGLPLLLALVGAWFGREQAGYQLAGAISGLVLGTTLASIATRVLARFYDHAT